MIFSFSVNYSVVAKFSCSVNFQIFGHFQFPKICCRCFVECSERCLTHQQISAGRRGGAIVCSVWPCASQADEHHSKGSSSIHLHFVAFLNMFSSTIEEDDEYNFDANGSCLFVSFPSSKPSQLALSHLFLCACWPYYSGIYGKSKEWTKKQAYK